MLRVKTLKYFEIAKVNFNNSTAYLLNVFSRSALLILRIWIYTQLYTVTFAQNNSTEIGGLSLTMVIWSLMLAQSFNSSTKPMLSGQIDEEVKSGTIAYSINKPYSYSLFHYAGFIGRTVPNVFSNVVIGGLAAIVLVGPINFNLLALICGALLLLFGFTIDFFIGYIIGLTAFWIEDTSAFIWIYSKGQLVFGGMILPIALFPDYLKSIVEYSPFTQLYYSAARIIVNFEPALFWQYLLTQISWIAIFWLISFLLFKSSIKNVAINGG